MTVDALSRIRLYQGDITRMTVDAIVNAANRSLMGGGGVDGAIHHAGGRELLAECRTLGGCETGDAKITGGYDLPAAHVIHTVGPVFSNLARDEPRLASCYRRCLEVALEHGVETLAFPGISTGVYRFPMPQACRIAFDTVVSFLEQHPGIEQVTFCQFGTDAQALYSREMARRKAAER
jgi:O-acetyl-ADP-ribose deacetylase